MTKNIVLNLLSVILLVLELEASRNCSQDKSNLNNVDSDCNVVKNFTDCGIRGNSIQSPFSCGLERIVGGCTAQPGELPWLCALLHNNQFRCSATLLYTNPAVVLTAAHCVKDGDRDLDKSSLLLYCGVYNLTSQLNFHDQGYPPSSLDILEVVVHEDYNHLNDQNDIALIKVEDKNIFLDKDRVYPICFPSKEETYEGWNKTFTAGWGANYTGGPHTLGPPRKVQVVPASDENCSRVMDSGYERIKPGMMCAGGRKGKDSCQGDSGGPLMSSADGITWSLTGIVSFGNMCGLEGEYGVYTRVSDYLDWIENTFRSNPSISVIDLFDGSGNEGFIDENKNDMNNVTSDHMNNVTSNYNSDQNENITIGKEDNTTSDQVVIIFSDEMHEIDNATPNHNNISFCDTCRSFLCDFQCDKGSLLSATIGAGAAAIFILVIILMIVCSRENTDQKKPHTFPEQGGPFSTTLSNTLSMEMQRKSSRMTKQSSFESTSRRKDDFIPPDYPPRIGGIPSSNFTSYSTSMESRSVHGSTLGSFTNTGKRSISSRVSPMNSPRTYRSAASKTSQFDTLRSKTSQFDTPKSRTSQFDTPRSKASQFNTQRTKTSKFDTPKSMDCGTGVISNISDDSRKRIMNDNSSEGSLASRMFPPSQTSSILGDWTEGSLPGTGDIRRKKMKVVPIPGQERVDIILRDRTSQDSMEGDMEREIKSAEADMDIGGKFEGMLEREKRIHQENIYEEPSDSLMTASYSTYVEPSELLNT